jgi:uncharacterized membrane protein YkoI
MKKGACAVLVLSLIFPPVAYVYSSTDAMSFINVAQGMGSADSAGMRLDAQECRRLADAGIILSMMALMEKVKALTDGHMLDTTLLKQGDRYIYEMEIAGKDGIVRMLMVDARTGMMIGE